MSVQIDVNGSHQDVNITMPNIKIISIYERHGMTDYFTLPYFTLTHPGLPRVDSHATHGAIIQAILMKHWKQKHKNWKITLYFLSITVETETHLTCMKQSILEGTDC